MKLYRAIGFKSRWQNASSFVRSSVILTSHDYAVPREWEVDIYSFNVPGPFITGLVVVEPDHGNQTN